MSPRCHPPEKFADPLRVKRKAVSSHSEIMALGHIRANCSVSITVGRRFDNLAVIIHTAEHDGFVGMPDDYVRSIGDTHLFHIFLRDCKHIIIGQPVAVFRRKAEGYITAWLLDFRPRQCR